MLLTGLQAKNPCQGAGWDVPSKKMVESEKVQQLRSAFLMWRGKRQRGLVEKSSQALFSVGSKISSITARQSCQRGTDSGALAHMLQETDNGGFLCGGLEAASRAWG